MSQADLTIESSGLPQAAPDKLSPQTVRLLGVLMVGAFVVILNETAMNVALSTIMVDLRVT